MMHYSKAAAECVRKLNCCSSVATILYFSAQIMYSVFHVIFPLTGEIFMNRSTKITLLHYNENSSVLENIVSNLRSVIIMLTCNPGVTMVHYL